MSDALREVKRDEIQELSRQEMEQTIGGGPVIGTLIGWGIGSLASNNNDDAALYAELDTFDTRS